MLLYRNNGVVQYDLVCGKHDCKLVGCDHGPFQLGDTVYRFRCCSIQRSEYVQSAGDAGDRGMHVVYLGYLGEFFAGSFGQFERCCNEQLGFGSLRSGTKLYQRGDFSGVGADIGFGRPYQRAGRITDCIGRRGEWRHRDGVVELGTFLAAIAATVASGFLAFYFRGHQERSGAILLGCTLIGLATSFGITRLPAANPARKFNRNPLGDLGEQIHRIRGDRVLNWAVVGNFYLWFLAALLQFTIVIYGHDILRIDDRHISYLQAAVAVGLGLGSLATGYLSDAKIEYGLIPVGAAGMMVFGFLSAGHGISLERAATYLGLLGFFGGFYAVPLNALIQHRPDPERKGGVIAAANLISFVGVFAAAGVYFEMAEWLRLRADEIFLAGAFLTLAATLYAVVFLPDSLLRLGMWALTHSIYRIRVEGRDNIPERGGALFLTQDLTPLKAMFLAAATDRPIHFVADAKPFARMAPVIRKAMRITYRSEYGMARADDGAIDRPIEELLRMAAAAFSAGEVVCLAGEAASDLLEHPAESERWEEFLRESNSPIVVVSVRDASGRPLQDDAFLVPRAGDSEIRRARDAGRGRLRGPGAPLAEGGTRPTIFRLQPRRLKDRQLHSKKDDFHSKKDNFTRKKATSLKKETTSPSGISRDSGGSR